MVKNLPLGLYIHPYLAYICALGLVYKNNIRHQDGEDVWTGEFELL